jgi:hypothetical protein
MVLECQKCGQVPTDRSRWRRPEENYLLTSGFPRVSLEVGAIGLLPKQSSSARVPALDSRRRRTRRRVIRPLISDNGCFLSTRWMDGTTVTSVDRLGNDTLRV